MPPHPPDSREEAEHAHAQRVATRLGPERIGLVLATAHLVGTVLAFVLMVASRRLITPTRG